MSARKKQADRLIKMSGLSLRVGGSYLKQKIREFLEEDSQQNEVSRSATHVRNAQRVVETLGEMKGTVMKLGQMLSLNSELLPKEIVSILSSLQGAAPPVDFETIRRQLHEAFGKPFNQVFAEFDEKPIAAASIGQAHRARLKDGRDAVVKVQYPGVKADVEGDMQNLKMFLQSLKVFKPFAEGLDLTHLTRELRARMLEELDYLNEAKNIETFRSWMADEPGIIIPEVFLEFCRPMVLTLAHQPGIGLQQFSASDASGTVRNQVGERLLRFYFKQMFEHDALHADPNAGNFAVGKNHELIVYDFGCVKYFPKTFIQNYKRLLRDYLAGNTENLEAGLDRLGIHKIKDKTYSREFYEAYGEFLMEPFLTEPYCFGEAQLQEKLLKLSERQLGDVLNFRPPQHILFHNRVVVGTYSNLRNLRATGYWRTLLEGYLKERK